MILTDENFEKEISKDGKPVLVDFWMQGCGPCLLISPILEKLEEEFSEKLIFAKVNFNSDPITIQKYGLSAAPTIIFFSKGELISGFIGLKPEEEIRKWIKENLLIHEYRQYAEKNEISLNPEKNIKEAIIKGLLEKEEKFGQKYCPCRKISGNIEEDKKIVCPCIYHLDEIEKDGHCLCRLFVKKV